ncbi:MAG: hypothetical protein PHS49_06375 [Candidatus Gracilibacteria bacterium]|nr:hypothetical protein [Candidatus Gracilibacteria bacterium]
MKKIGSKEVLENRIKKQKEKLDFLLKLKDNFKKHHKTVPVKMKKKISERKHKIKLLQRHLDDFGELL